MRVELHQLAPLVRELVAEHLCRGRRRDLADVTIEAGLVGAVARRVPEVLRHPAPYGAVAVICELGPTRAKLAACPCEVCWGALARFEDVPAGHVRLFLHDDTGERVHDLPRGWFDGEVSGG